MDKLILGIDAGSNQVKVFGPFGPDIFKSNICGWFVRNVIATFGDDDMEFEIDGRKGFAGTIAMYEDEFGSSTIYGESKAHDDTKTRVLLAIHRYISKYCSDVSRVVIVVGQPIKGHVDTEKELIKQMLIGKHQVKVNGKTRTFTIETVGVAPEGSAAFWAKRENGTIRIIDLGGGTCNAATINQSRHVNNESDTFNFGAETISNKSDYENIALGIARNTTKLKWHKLDKVYICGGMAEEITPAISKHYPQARVLIPSYKQGGVVKVFKSIYANAIGFYIIGKGAYG